MNPTLIEYFAVHETLNDLNQVPPEHADLVTAMLEHLAGPIPKDELEASAAWDAKWRAKLRFIRAKAMVEEAERIRAKGRAVNPNMPELDQCPMCMWWQFNRKCPNKGCPRHGVIPAMSPEQQRQTEEITRIYQGAPDNTFKDTTGKTTNLSFGEALEAMKKGSRVKRTGDTGILWFRIGPGDVFECMEPRVGNAFPCALTYKDIMASDWQIVEEP